MMPRRSTAVHSQIRRAGYGLAGKAALFSANVCVGMFSRTGSYRRADHEKRHRYFRLGQQWTQSRMGSPGSRRLSGVRRSNGMSETCRLRRGEGYGVCDDEEPSESPRHFAASMDESVIVGYYTLKKCPLRSPSSPFTLKERKEFYGKK